MANNMKMSKIEKQDYRAWVKWNKAGRPAIVKVNTKNNH